MNYDSPDLIGGVNVTLTVTDDTALFTTTTSFNVTVVDINQGRLVIVYPPRPSIRSNARIVERSLLPFETTGPRFLNYPLEPVTLQENR